MYFVIHVIDDIIKLGCTEEEIHPALEKVVQHTAFEDWPMDLAKIQGPPA